MLPDAVVADRLPGVTHREDFRCSTGQCWVINRDDDGCTPQNILWYSPHHPLRRVQTADRSIEVLGNST
jgi:hypothetical protein